MKIAVAGHKGFVGSELIKRGCVPLDCDVTKRNLVEYEVNRVSPDVIIYAATEDNVEWCEENQKGAYNVNVQGVVNVTDYFGGVFIYLSSVHVFSGSRYFDYSEKQKPDPISVFGFTKWGGEIATDVSSFLCKRAIVVRTSKLFNYKFLEENIHFLQDGCNIEASDLLKRSFLYLPHFVDGIFSIIHFMDDIPDLIHIAGTDTMSYYKFWDMIAMGLDIDPNLVEPAKFGKTDVPNRGGLSTSLAKKLGIPLYSASDGIKEMLE
jgi:dTDP-4-dehydrorhamnose reductase